MKETGPRQLTIAFADNPSGGGENEPSDASERRGFLLLKARSKKTRGPGTSVADTSRLLEDVASEANLATALLKVVRNKGAPGVDGQTVEMAEAQAPSIIAALRRDLLAGCYRPGEIVMRRAPMISQYFNVCDAWNSASAWMILARRSRSASACLAPRKLQVVFYENHKL